MRVHEAESLAQKSLASDAALLDWIKRHPDDADTRLYVVDLLGGPSRIRAFSLAGKELPEVDLPPVSGVRQIVREKGDTLLFRSQTYIEPPAFYRYDPKAKKSVKRSTSRRR